MKKKTDTDTSRLKELLDEANVIKKDLVKKRDRLRDIQWELENIIESCDEFVEAFDTAREEYTTALNQISKFL